ncbi:hypothetical protein FRACYDRAFT_237280 [Fragilariopsis cylindrus CCMP1102]|uniref:Uncharacterized protein n=1 Tax=Fragilariopsis cylindrus CCMP1102 TaxID=635003 RepID=A0A1E7FLE3_9STRA|nr:hypothetical protein FRACYDRAFT_237280 [Fragilariopsis cylindrus CCMP1102]|eukprot:OEU18990.1 hypothetical protein FRACYDRAFT_237280 [Fragilariopsis cylindrus CCMP1102]
MAFTEGGFQTAILGEATRAKESNSRSQLITHPLTFNRTTHLPDQALFCGIGTLGVAVLNTQPKKVTPILWVRAYQTQRFGITITSCPQAVIFDANDLVASDVWIAKDADSTANQGLDYVTSALIKQRPMMKLIPIRAETITDFFNADNSHKSVRDLITMFKSRTDKHDKFVYSWLRAAAMVRDTTLPNNADSTSQMQLEPDQPRWFTLAHSVDIYKDLQTGFSEDDNTLGTAIANGVLNCLSKEFRPTPAPEDVIDVDDETLLRNNRQRTGNAPGETATNEANLNAVLQRNVQLEEQLAQQQRIAAALARQHQSTRTATGNVSFEGDGLPYGTGHPVSSERPERTGLPFDIAANPFEGNGFSNDSSSTFQQPAARSHNPYGTPGATNPFGEPTPGHPGYHGAPAFTFGASASNGAFSFGGHTGASPHQSIGDHLHAMLNRGPGLPLTSEDMNRFQVLKFLAAESKSHPNSTKPDQPKKAKDSMGTRSWNLCGWAHLQPHELHFLHRCNNSGWLKYNKAPDKGEKDSVICTFHRQSMIGETGL